MSYPNMLGIRGIKFVWHGEWSDPEVIIKRKYYNYWDIEDMIWEYIENNYDIKFKDSFDFHSFVEKLPAVDKKEIYWFVCDMLGI